MLEKIKELSEAARLKYGVWKRERQERKAEKQAQAYSEHGHGRFFLLTVPATATICAAIVEVYWAFLFCIEATGHLAFDFSTAIGSEAAATSAWNFAFVVNSVAVLLGLALATVPIVMISMVWLPVQFTMRGTGRWRRGTMIFCGLLANILVIVSGTVVMNGNRQEQVRESVVVEQTAAQGRAAIDARLAFEQEQLRLALANTNPYLNQAANVGAEEWEHSYVAQARATNDPRLPQLERALGAARAADARRANIERLTVERATAAPEAASAATVEDTAGQSLNQFSQAVQVWRPPFVAFICTLVGIFGAWWTLALMQGLNPRDVLRSGWADEGHRIEDLRHEEPIERGSAQMQTVVEEEDLETGEKRRLVTPKPHWRTLKKGRKQKIEIVPEVEADEVGVTHDGGNRIAVGADGLGGVMESVEVLQDSADPLVEAVSPNDASDERKEEDGGEEKQPDDIGSLPPSTNHIDGEVLDHPDSPEYPQEYLEALDTLAGSDGEQSVDSEAQGDEAEQQSDYEHDEPRQPETNPAKMIAAE